jgi:hypothetical protein
MAVYNNERKGGGRWTLIGTPAALSPAMRLKYVDDDGRLRMPERHTLDGCSTTAPHATAEEGPVLKVKFRDRRHRRSAAGRQQ